MKPMRFLMLAAAVLTGFAVASCEREDTPEAPTFQESLLLGKWYFPVDSTLLWSGRSMTVRTQPSPVVEVDSVVVMRWACDGNQITAMHEDSNRVWKFQFRVLDLNDTALTIEGAYGYATSVNGSQWSGSGINGHTWAIAGTLKRDSAEYRIWDELF